MVGAGIFNLPGRFGAATGPFGAIIAWTIAGTGMYMLARVFQALAERKPDIDAGVFAYAKAGFGDYMGFLSAFGYWLGSCLGNVFYWVLIGSTLGAFFPVFGGGSTVTAIVVSLIGIWTFHFMILQGRGAGGLHQLGRDGGQDRADHRHHHRADLRVQLFAVLRQFLRRRRHAGEATVAQVRDTMLITVFVFLGIEGASVYSRFAKTRADVGRATILGFVGVTGLMVAITLLPYASMMQSQIAGLRQPSLAGVLESVVGHWGAIFISVGVLVSVLGAYLAWSLICAEVMFAAAKSKDMPKIFGAQNGNRVPANALWLTNVVVSLFVISTYWSRDAFNFMLDMTSVTTLLPYLLVAGYGVLLARSGEGYEGVEHQRGRDQIFSWIAVVYVLFMFLAAGLKYVLLVAVLYVPGTILYVWARKDWKMPLFSPRDLIIFAVTAVAGLVGVWRPAVRHHHTLIERCIRTCPAIRNSASIPKSASCAR